MFGFIGSIGVPELILILVVALVIFGPGKLPEVGRSIGKSINEFKNASKEIKKDLTEGVTEDSESQKQLS